MLLQYIWLTLLIAGLTPDIRDILYLHRMTDTRNILFFSVAWYTIANNTLTNNNIDKYI